MLYCAHCTGCLLCEILWTSRQIARNVSNHICGMRGSRARARLIRVFNSFVETYIRTEWRSSSNELACIHTSGRWRASRDCARAPLLLLYVLLWHHCYHSRGDGPGWRQSSMSVCRASRAGVAARGEARGSYAASSHGGQRADRATGAGPGRT